MLDQRLRAEVEQKLRPLGARLRRSGFTADQITVLGLAASVYTAVAIATGHFFLAAVGVAASGLTDVLDGAVAKADGTAGPRGAFFDSVCDRVSDAVVLGGAAWYLAGGPDPRLAVLAFAVASLAHLVSYQRSRAESLGLVGNGGLAERAERMVVLGLGLAFDALVFSLWLLLVLTSITVVQRFVAVWNQVPSPARAEQAAERRAPWWLTPRAPDADESRLVRWRSALAPPGERRERPRRDTSAAGPLTRWLASARPSRTGTPRWYRWRFGAAGSGVEERTEARRRWRGRNRP